MFWIKNVVRGGVVGALFFLVVSCAPPEQGAAPGEATSVEASAAYERWFMPGPLGYEPGRPQPEVTERAFLTRALGGTDVGDGGVWARANRITPRLSFSHNLSRVVPGTLFMEYPEFFPELGGQRWEPPRNRVNWNPDLGNPALAEYVAGVAKAFFTEHPEAMSFALGTNDGLVYGESGETLQWVYPPRWFRQRPDYSDLIFQFMNAAAEHIEAEYPDRYLGALAYYWSENVPSFPLHRQVLPFLTADRSQFYDPSFKEEELALQRAWGASGAERLGIYDYSYGRGFLIPRIYMHAFSEHLGNAREAGFTDYFAEMSPSWGIDGPQPWVMAQLLQDPEQEVTALLNEYYGRFFGPAAGSMRAFFDLAERLWTEQEGPSYWLKHFRNESQALVIPGEARRELRQYLETAVAEAGTDEVVAARVAFVSRAFGLTERFLELVDVRRELGDALFAEHQADAGFEALLHKYNEARDDLLEYARLLTAEEPLAFRSPDLSGYLLHDPGPTAKAHLTGRLASPEAAVEGLVAAEWPLGDRTGQEIAGLPYRLDLPEAWRSQVEPWENLKTEVRREGDVRVLRLENHKVTSFWQWVSMPDDHVGQAKMEVRGDLSPGAYVLLSVRWATAGGVLVGPSIDVRLPEGQWPEWVPLRQFIESPPEAELVLFRCLVAHQQAGDWIEFGRPSLLFWTEESAEGLED